MYQAVIFDLDGTILDTIGDLTDNLNEALHLAGYNITYNDDEVKYFVGSGADVQIRRAMKKIEHTEEDIQRLKKIFMTIYARNNANKTQPYQGIIATLKKIKDAGIRLYCLTNKPHDIAQEVVSSYFGNDIFIEVLGQLPNRPVKPDPTLLNELIERHALNKLEVLFVGDSDIDIQVALNANVDSAWVSWGFRKAVDVAHLRPDYYVSNMQQLYEICALKPRC